MIFKGRYFLYFFNVLQLGMEKESNKDYIFGKNTGVKNITSICDSNKKKINLNFIILSSFQVLFYNFK